MSKEGWVCPHCGKVYAPHIDKCPDCVVATGGTMHYVFLSPPPSYLNSPYHPCDPPPWWDKYPIWCGGGAISKIQ